MTWARLLSNASSGMIKTLRSVLLHGFIKKTQQTPNQNIDLAEKRFKEWQRGET